MIYVIIILAVLLILLLVDWGSILRRLRKNSHRVSAPNHFAQALTANSEALEMEPSGEPLVATSPKPGHKCPPEVEKILQEADIHFRKGEMKAAEELYVQAAASDPRCGKAYSRLGVIYLEHEENLDDAEGAFRQALKIEPNNGYILNNLGLVLYHQDKFADAIRHFEQAVRLDEFNAGRQANLGMAYLAMRQFAKAESAFKRALKLSPNEAEYKDLLNEAIEKKQAHKAMVRR